MNTKPKYYPEEDVVFDNHRKHGDYYDTGVIVHVSTIWNSDKTCIHLYSILPHGRKNKVKVLEEKIIETIQ